MNWKVLSVCLLFVCIYACMCVCMSVYDLEIWKQEPVSGAVTCKKREIFDQNQQIDNMIFEPHPYGVSGSPTILSMQFYD